MSPMKLYFVHGCDQDDVTSSFDWFVVAENLDEAIRLWKNAVRSYCGRPGTKKEIDDVREILPTVEGTRFEGKARYISWDDMPIVLEGNRRP